MLSGLSLPMQALATSLRHGRMCVVSGVAEVDGGAKAKAFKGCDVLVSESPPHSQSQAAFSTHLGLARILGVLLEF